MIGMDGRSFVFLSENAMTGMAGLTPGPAGSGMQPVAIFLIMTGTAIDRLQSPGGYMTFILYSRVAVSAGDFITMRRRCERPDVYAVAAFRAARFVAINTLLLGIGTELVGWKHDQQGDQA